MIDFFCEDTDFMVADPEVRAVWIGAVIDAEGKLPGAINYIFCSDEYLLRINQEYLQHDFYTDIITFDYGEGHVVSGDLFISVDRVRENAVQLNVAFDEELHRVMVHGVLHLLGQRDKTTEEQEEMRAAEDRCLALRQRLR